MNTHPKKQLRIIQCRDSLMWYADLVGQTVPYLGTWPEGYRSREPAGYINVVRFQDAEVIDMESDFQQRVQPWMLACFGAEIAADKAERNHRFLEEAIELVQATGCTAGEAHQLVDYVYGRPVGEPVQEVGGVMVTLAALCLTHDMDMHGAAETELARIWTKVEQIRAKQAAKPKHSPLPEYSEPAQSVNARLIEALRFYAAGHHFTLFNKDAWDTVSGEPLNLLFDEADTAMVEDGSIAKAAIAEAGALQISFDLHTARTGVKEFFDGEYFQIKGIVDATKCRGQRQEEECQPYFYHCLVMQGGGGITGDDFHGTVYFHLGADQYLAVEY